MIRNSAKWHNFIYGISFTYRFTPFFYLILISFAKKLYYAYFQFSSLTNLNLFFVRENKLKERISYNLEKHNDLIKSYNLEFIYDYEIKDGIFADLAIFQNGHKLALMNNSECDYSESFNSITGSKEHNFWGTDFVFWVLCKTDHFHVAYMKSNNPIQDFINRGSFRTFLYRIAIDDPR